MTSFQYTLRPFLKQPAINVAKHQMMYFLGEPLPMTCSFYLFQNGTVYDPNIIINVTRMGFDPIMRHF